EKTYQQIPNALDTTLPLQGTKRLKLGNDLATVTSLSVQGDTDMVASENVQQVDAPKKEVPESAEASLGHGSDKDAATVPKDDYREVVSETKEREDVAVKDSVMVEAGIDGKKRESVGESDDSVFVPSLKSDDYFSDSDSDIES
ncbi:hypothetical protein AALP_AA5G101500, partial [Arabis alpina]